MVCFSANVTLSLEFLLAIFEFRIPAELVTRDSVAYNWRDGMLFCARPILNAKTLAFYENLVFKTPCHGNVIAIKTLSFRKRYSSFWILRAGQRLNSSFCRSQENFFFCRPQLI